MKKKNKRRPKPLICRMPDTFCMLIKYITVILFILSIILVVTSL